jgi:hypothetical protein
MHDQIIDHTYANKFNSICTIYEVNQILGCLSADFPNIKSFPGLFFQQFPNLFFPSSSSTRVYKHKKCAALLTKNRIVVTAAAAAAAATRQPKNQQQTRTKTRDERAATTNEWMGWGS